MKKICGLIVTYNPEIDVLRAVVCSLASNVDRIIIYDNGSDDVGAVFEGLSVSIEIPFLVQEAKENIGIAGAQNWLLFRAKELGYGYAILSDQDSIYPTNFASSLFPVLATNPRVAAVFPGWMDRNLGADMKYPGQFVFGKLGFLKINVDEEVIEISHAIASGMLLNLNTLADIGFMKADLFIDWVDNEWCWRANARGYRLLSLPSVKLSHSLGDKTVVFAGRKFVQRGLERNYYIVRNALFIMLHSEFGFGIRFYLLKKLIHHSFFSVILSDEKLKQLRFLARAYVDGTLSRLGKLK